MTTKKTIADLLEDLNRLRLKQAVLGEAIEYLSKFISTDSYTPLNGIASPVDQGIIPEGVVEEVRDVLQVMKAEMEDQISELTGRPVSGKKATLKKKTSTRKKKVSRRAPPKRRKSSAKKA